MTPAPGEHAAEPRLDTHGQERVRGYLDRLGADPPPVVLLEGGIAAERRDLALFYAARLNCMRPDPPCGVCTDCVQVMEKVHPDLVWMDGSSQQIRIDEVREVRSKLGEPPRGAGLRVIAVFEAQGLGMEAANCLLKSLEEPRPGNAFVLTAPQRETLLPTLVSRSWPLTLAWPRGAQPHRSDVMADQEEGEDPAYWLYCMHEFWRTGRGFLEMTGTRGRVDRELALAVVLAAQRDVAQVLSGRLTSRTAQALDRAMDPHGLRRLDLLLDQAAQALDYQVNPGLVLDWLATTVHGWLNP
jgi:DNA polymerase-3 subunit delta'